MLLRCSNNQQQHPSLFPRQNCRIGLFFVVGLFVVICLQVAVDAVEVKVDEAGNVVDEETSSFGREFGAATSTISSSSELKPWSTITEIFPHTIQSLSDVWESHPVYLPASLSLHSDATPTNLPQLVDAKNPPSHDRFRHLFRVDDAITVLNNTNLVHGTDYLLLKYILKDGEEWSGRLPYSSIPVQELPKLINEKSFSLVINNLHKLWKPIEDISRSLELEVLSYSTSCNLYITPPGAARAFESHIDWMDVIVLQLDGEKDWSVWQEPFVKLVPPDEKRKPTMAELRSGSFENVRLRPGDALYIPRGYLHNATTPPNSRSLSMHATIGIEHGFDSTMETLLHYALELFTENGNNRHTLSIAIPGTVCENNNGLTYEAFLHFAISELVRSTNCGGFGESTDNSRIQSDAICDLRRSIPLHPQMQQLQGRRDKDVTSTYVSGLEAIGNHVSISNTLSFINKVTSLMDPAEKALGSKAYRYPGMKEVGPYNCKANSDKFLSQTDFQEFTEDFIEFSRTIFGEARQRLITRNDESRVAN